MPETTVAIVQHRSALLDLNESLRRVATHIADAASAGATPVVFPETWLTRYPAWVFGLAGWRDETTQRWHARLLNGCPVLDHDGGTDDMWRPSGRRPAMRE